MSGSNEIEANEAFAFLQVIAPKLEQLRRRLAVSKDLLMGGDPEKARLDAIIESQLALKEFLSGIANLNALVEPIDVLLEALREESVEQAIAIPEPLAPITVSPVAPVAPPKEAPVPVNEVASAPAKEEPPVVSKGEAAAPAKHETSGEIWLQVGTVFALEKLINAGMPAANAEAHLERTYATVGLKQVSGAPITTTVIREWRRKLIGPVASAWRRQRLSSQKISAAPAGTSLLDVKGRVDELAIMFKKMAGVGGG